MRSLRRARNVVAPAVAIAHRVRSEEVRSEEVRREEVRRELDAWRAVLPRLP